MRVRIALVAVLMGVAVAIRAETSWAPIGPPGGFVDFVVSSPSAPETVYVGSRAGGGVYVSGDSGITWRAANAGLTDTRITSLAVSPADARVAYAGTQSGGFETTDGGASWIPLGGGFPSSIVDAFAIDPSSPSRIYAIGTSGALSRSSDAGATWSNIGNEDTTAAQPQRLAVDPSQGETLYLATALGGVFRTGDGGRSWDASTSGLENVFGDRSVVQTVAVDPSNRRRVYAGTASDGVFVSTDAGAHWTRSSDGFPYSENSFNGFRFYFLVSDILIRPDGTAYAAAQNSVYVRRPGASVWTDLGVDFEANQLALGPGTPPVLYLAIGRNIPGQGGPLSFGAFGRFDAAGLTFHGFSFVTVWSIATDPFAPGAVVLTANGAFEWAPGEGADAWSGPVPYFADFSFLLPLSSYFDARTPEAVYAGSGGRVYKSVDGGRTYPTGAIVGNPGTAPGAIVETFIAEPGSSGIFAGTTTGLFVSEDAGGSWISGSADLASRKVFALAADAFHGSTLWAGTDDGVYKSTDSGAHWSRTGATLGGRVAAVLAVAGGGGVLAGGDAGLSASSDGGATWTTVAGMNAPVNALAQDPRSGFIAAGTTAGVFESTDAGATWAASIAGLDNPNVRCLSFLEDGALLAGTSGGVFERIVTTGRGTDTRTPSRRRAPKALSDRP
jgi:photosystem II stability/assembly factor-like uncharacterized protein